MRRAILAIVFALVFCVTPSVKAVPLDVIITVDNAYGFGFGDVNGIYSGSYYGGIRNVLAGEIFNGPPVLVTGPAPSPYTIPGVGPERYSVDLASWDDYVYIVGWSDDSVYQGALAGFELPGGQLLSGSGLWEVFATGLDRDSNVVGDTLTTSDLLTVINPQIVLANANGGGSGTSIGWVDENGLLPDDTPGVGELAVGPLNQGSGFHGYVVNGISSDSNWMWYNESPSTIPDAFTAISGSPPAGADGHNEFLIFRIHTSDLIMAVPEPGSIMVAAFGFLGLCFLWRRKGPNAS